MRLNSLKDFDKMFAPEYENFPKGRYISIVMVRKTESETIFRTEGGGEGLAQELVYFEGESVNRVVITKRKQIAVERRTGRDLLRRYDKLFVADEKSKEVCALNRNKPCGLCVDCHLYGYAVGGGGAQKSRVLSQDAYSLLPSSEIIDTRTFNGLYENGTMYDNLTGKHSSSINEADYVKPGVHFIDIQTLKDVTEEEFIYVLGNILRSSRYGAISSKIGRMENMIIDVYFSDCELPSNLEVTREVVKKLNQMTYPIETKSVVETTQVVIKEQVKNLFGQVSGIGNQLDELLDEVKSIYQSEDKVKELLDSAMTKYPK